MFSSVDCSEEHGTRQENYVQFGTSTCAVVLRTPWANRQSLVSDILSNLRSWPDEPYIIARSASVVPDLTDYTVVGQEIVYTDALATVQYSNEGNSGGGEGGDPQDLISEVLEPQIEFLDLDHKGFRWGSASGDPLKEEEAPGKRVFTMNITRTFYNRLAFPLAVLGSVGYVHNSPWTSPTTGLTYPPNTLMYMAPSLSRNLTLGGGVPTWEIATKWTFRPYDWNKFWRADTQQWEGMYIADGAQYYNYPLGNLISVLQL